MTTRPLNFEKNQMKPNTSAIKVDPQTEKLAKIAARPQAHGGALNSGSPKPGGHGIGRPKAEVRHKLLEKVSVAIDILEAMLSGELPVKEDTLIRCIDIVARYGLGTQDEVVSLDTAAVPIALADVLARRGFDHDESRAIAKELAEKLGIRD